jgi:hypothetical protein
MRGAVRCAFLAWYRLGSCGSLLFSIARHCFESMESGVAALTKPSHIKRLGIIMVMRDRLCRPAESTIHLQHAAVPDGIAKRDMRRPPFGVRFLVTNEALGTI